MIQQFFFWIFTTKNKKKTRIQKDVCTSMFTAVLFTITNIYKQLKYPSVDECIKTFQCVFVYMCVCVCVCVCVYYWALNKNEILPFATTWVDFKGIMLSELSRRRINIIQFLLYVESINFANEMSLYLLDFNQRNRWWILSNQKFYI